MSATDVLTTVNTRRTLQSEKSTPGQVKNNAGGYVFQVTPETRIRRFLVLGTTGGTYYQGEQELTKENAVELLEWARYSTTSLVDLIVEISVAGRAPKQNPAIFALAAAAGLGDEAGRAYALRSLSKVARTGTHLFLFAQYVEQFRGWGPALVKAVANWYEAKDSDKLAYQMVKYRQRNGWSHRDLLRLSHPEGSSRSHKALYTWATKGLVPNVGLEDSIPSLVLAFVEAQSTTDASRWVSLIENSELSWEMLPDAALKEPLVWEALIDRGMPQAALIRQLPRLTKLGVLKGSRLAAVASQIINQERLTKARIHPMSVLTAQVTYERGQSVRGSSTWTPSVKIIDALDEAFYKSFGNVEPSNKRILNALDVSGSMVGHTDSSGLLTARDVSAAMSLITVTTEPDVRTVGFTGGSKRLWSRDAALTPLTISPRQRLDDVVRTISGLPFGATDCALPMIWAKENDLEVDSFYITTDNETWCGEIHPMQALREYRQASGINAKLVVLAVTPTPFSIADPEDSGSLDVVGFDSAVPNLISDFSAGRI